MKTLFRSAFTRLLIAGAALGALACESGGVGDPCIPEDEYNRQFSSFSIEEVNVESRSFQCETRVCLVNKFQGRVSCPYGQQSTDVPGDGVEGLPADHPMRCRIPGTTGRTADGTLNEDDAVQVQVEPQFELRRDDRAVYCSCRCANADGKKNDGASYCECPSGFSCTKLVDDVGLGGTQLAGSYCVRNGTDLVERGQECIVSRNTDGSFGSEGNCANDFQNP